MVLAAGSQLGVYEVLAPLGRGGMGEVWKARDIRLNREVALKILPNALAHDPDPSASSPSPRAKSRGERLARFRREAQVLASLNHPNIGAIYSLEEADGITALVLELVEGATLADLIAGTTSGDGLAAIGPSRRDGATDPQPVGRRTRPTRGHGLPIDAALSIARQMAEALEAAHEAGVIHRDLKPANIMVQGTWGPRLRSLSSGGTRQSAGGAPAATPMRGKTATANEDSRSPVTDLKVKVLDFGLAKALDASRTGGAGAVVESQSPTGIAPPETMHGVILGTAAYMSPEQARGMLADERTDIWAFGAVLFEMLTGKRAFEGNDASDTLANVLKVEPDWTALPADLSPTVSLFLRRCLRKDPKQRVQAIGDVRLALEGAFDAPTDVPSHRETERPTVRRTVGLVLASVAATMLTAGLLAWVLWPDADAGAAMRFEVTTPPEAPPRIGDFSDLAISTDGARVVYGTGTSADSSRAYVREAGQLDATEIRAAETPFDLFFSPDGERIGFRDLGNRAWKHVSVSGGPPVTIADNRPGYAGGGSWGADGTIVFGGVEGLWEVRADGGIPELLTTVDPATGATSHRWPDVLPRGDAVLFTEWTTNPANAWVAVVSRESGEITRLVSGASHPRYASTGHIIYGMGGTLWAVGFDASRLALTSAPLPLIEGVRTSENTGAVLFDVADNGSLVYLADATVGPLERVIVRVDRSGEATVIETVPAGELRTPRVSPDGSRVLVSSNGDAWLYNLSDGRSRRLTTDGATLRYLAWDPTGTRFAYSSTAGGADNDIWIGAVDGSAEPRLLIGVSGSLDVESWSPDGRVLAAHQHTRQGEDLVTIRIDQGTPELRPLRADEFSTAGVVFSPDGRYVAYSSDESGREEVYVRPFESPGGQETASVMGGREPVWGKNGELFYRSLAGDRLMAVTVETDPALVLGSPREVFSGQYYRDQSPVPQYDVAADGQQFLMLSDVRNAAADTDTARPKIVLVQNFSAELKTPRP